MPSIGNHVDAVFIPESVNTSTTLRITGGDLIVNTNDLVVDESTNRVGIGTDNPGSNLDIAATGFVNLKLRTTGNNSSTINLQNSQRNFSVNNVTGGAFTIHDGTASAERLRITSGGLVGIGTNNPQTELDIQSATDPKLRLESKESGNKRLDLWIDGGEAIGYIAADQSASQLAFRTTGTERLRITSDGFIGISNSSPELQSSAARNLVIGTPGSGGQNGLTICSNTSGTNNIYFGDASSGQGESMGRIVYSHADDSLRLHTVVQERFRITSTGNIGIGTDTPTAESGFTKVLHVYDDSPQVLLERETGSGDVKAGFNVWSGNASLETFTATPLRIRTDGNTNQLYLSTNGNIGIGTDSPDTLLNLFGTGNATIKVHNNSAAAGTYSRLQLITGGSASSARSEIRSLRMSTASAATNLAFFTTLAGDTSPTERFRITSDGNVGIGTDSPQSKLDINGSNSELRFYRDDRARFGGIRYDGTLLKVRLPQGDHLAVYNSTESLLGVIVKSTGEVGVGTIGPEEKLHVVGGSLKLDAISNLKFGAAGATGVALRDETNILGGSLDGTLGAVTMAYLAQAPSSPVQGQFYFNSLSSKAQIYTGSSFVDLVPSGGGGGGGGGSSTDANATFRKYTYSISSTTNSVTGSSDTVVSAGSFVVGHKYTIKTVGTTTFTDIGASANTVGTVFTATGVGSGNGDAYETLFYSTGGDQNVEVYVNGVKAVEGSTNDYVATSGTSVNFVANLASGDVVDIQVYELLTNDAYVLATGGTFTGNVGINTSTINNRLHIHSNANDQGILLSQAGSNYNGLIADANRNAADNYILNLQANWNGNGVARIALETGNDTTNKDDGRIKFSTSLASSTPEVRMHISPNGTVAIGLPENTEAVAKLDVMGTGTIPSGLRNYTYASNDGLRVVGTEVAIDLVGEDNGSHASSILFRNENEGFSIHNRPNTDSFHFKSFTTSANNFTIHDDGNISASVDIMSFTKAGLVGIGTTEPGANLQVEGHLAYLVNRVNTANTYFKAENTGVGNAGIQMKNSQGEWIIIANDRLRFIDQDNTTERFTIASNGSIGINKTTPIAYGNSQATLVIEDDTNPALCLSDTGQTRDWFLVALGDGLAVRYADGGGANASSNVTNSAFFRNDGKVGIGTAEPNGLLTVGSVDSPTFNRGAVAIKAVVDGNNLPTNIYLEEVSGAEGYQLSMNANGDLNFHNSGAAAPTVTFSDGNNVGIGEDSPTSRLVVQQTNSSGDVAIRVKNDTTTDGSASTPTTASLYLTTSTGDFNTFYMQARRYDNETWFGYADPRGNGHVPTMVLSNDGNIGIGETVPNRKLYITGIDGDTYSSTSGSNNAYVRIHNKNGTDNTGVGYQSGVEMYVGTGATTVGMLTMVRTGNNIGDLTYKTRTGASSYNEHFRITSAGKLILKPGADSGNILQLNGADTTSEILEAGIASGYVQFTATHASGGSNTCGFTFRTRGGAGGTNEKVRITPTGNVGIGTNGPGTKLDVNGVVKVHERTSGTPARIAMQSATANMAPTARLEFWEGSVGTYSDAHGSIEYDGTTDNGGDGAIIIRGWVGSNGSNQKIAVFNREGNVFIPSGRLVVNHQTSDLLSTHHFIAVGSKAAFQFDGNEGTWFGITNASANGAVTLEANARTGGWPPLHVKVGNNIALKLTSANGAAHFRDHIHFGGRHDSNSDTNTGRLGYIPGQNTAYGTLIEHSSHVVLTNEQGSTVQAMTLGDTSGGTDGKALWAVSVNTLSVSDPDTTGQESGWSQKARVEGNGDFVHSGSHSASGSDDRLKTNKVTIFNVLSKVQAMEGFSYEWNEVAEKIGMADDKTHLGLSAQTVEAVAPEVVVVNDTLVNPDDGTNDYKTIQYERLVPLLVEAIKEQQGIIDQLKQRLDDAGL